MSQPCHPEEGVFCPTRDLSEPRESAASFAAEKIARLARLRIALIPSPQDTKPPPDSESVEA